MYLITSLAETTSSALRYVPPSTGKFVIGHFVVEDYISQPPLQWRVATLLCFHQCKVTKWCLLIRCLGLKISCMNSSRFSPSASWNAKVILQGKAVPEGKDQKTTELPVFVNKVLLQHSRTHFFMYFFLWPLSPYNCRAELWPPNPTIFAIRPFTERSAKYCPRRWQSDKKWPKFPNDHVKHSIIQPTPQILG